uniref:Uncharacterized protein n=1 Tax=Pinguiococcus pyrenoidosus TaxID=172671 RepID=A0A7R9UDJ3_9STRA|mmetsp:Transcript_5696/g.22344  ORF Transcript_5696/g.22344 Transcript_5696/m.22344 type:complete len:1018 (+) Transcript_5696:138-3191(+)
MSSAALQNSLLRQKDHSLLLLEHQLVEQVDLSMRDLAQAEAAADDRLRHHSETFDRLQVEQQDTFHRKEQRWKHRLDERDREAGDLRLRCHQLESLLRKAHEDLQAKEREVLSTERRLQASQMELLALSDGSAKGEGELLKRSPEQGEFARLQLRVADLAREKQKQQEENQHLKRRLKSEQEAHQLHHGQAERQSSRLLTVQSALAEALEENAQLKREVEHFRVEIATVRGNLENERDSALERVQSTLRESKRLQSEKEHIAQRHSQLAVSNRKQLRRTAALILKHWIRGMRLRTLSPALNRWLIACDMLRDEEGQKEREAREQAWREEQRRALIAADAEVASERKRALRARTIADRVLEKITPFSNGEILRRSFQGWARVWLESRRAKQSEVGAAYQEALQQIEKLENEAASAQQKAALRSILRAWASLQQRVVFGAFHRWHVLVSQMRAEERARQQRHQRAAEERKAQDSSSQVLRRRREVIEDPRSPEQPSDFWEHQSPIMADGRKGATPAAKFHTWCAPDLQETFGQEFSALDDRTSLSDETNPAGLSNGDRALKWEEEDALQRRREDLLPSRRPSVQASVDSNAPSLEALGATVSSWGGRSESPGHSTNGLTRDTLEAVRAVADGSVMMDELRHPLAASQALDGASLGYEAMARLGADELSDVMSRLRLRFAEALYDAIETLMKAVDADWRELPSPMQGAARGARGRRAPLEMRRQTREGFHMLLQDLLGSKLRYWALIYLRTHEMLVERGGSAQGTDGTRRSSASSTEASAERQRIDDLVDGASDLHKKAARAREALKLLEERLDPVLEDAKLVWHNRRCSIADLDHQTAPRARSKSAGRARPARRSQAAKRRRSESESRKWKQQMRCPVCISNPKATGIADHRASEAANASGNFLDTGAGPREFWMAITPPLKIRSFSLAELEQMMWRLVLLVRCQDREKGLKLFRAEAMRRLLDSRLAEYVLVMLQKSLVYKDLVVAEQQTQRGSGAGPTGRVHVRLRINDVNGVNDSS